MTTNIILKDVSKFYGKKQALNGINLEIEKGMFGLLGRNGAGKTTLMKSIATLHSVSSGDITVCGINISESSKIREMIGYLPQDFSMYSNMSASDLRTVIIQLIGSIYFNKKIILKNIKNHLFIV